MNEKYNILKDFIDQAPKEHENFVLNCLPSIPSQKDYIYTQLVSVPLSIEPTTIDYRPFLPPCFDQGQRGSCTAQGGVGLKAYQEIKQGDYPINGLSRAHLYCETKKLEGNTTEGAQPKNVMIVLKKIGVCTEDTMPYSTLTNLPVNVLPVIPSKAVVEASKYKINTYAQLCGINDINRNGTLNTIRTALKNEGIITLAFLVYDNFIPDINGFLPLPKGLFRGAHQVNIAGDLPFITCPDGTKGSLILRNSWGPFWGINGYAYLPYSWLNCMMDITGNGNRMWAVFESWTATDIIVTQPITRAKKIVITIGSNTITVDNVLKSLDQPAIIDPKTNRTLLPVRAVAENTGCKVIWDSKCPNIVNLIDNFKGKNIIITIGSNTMNVNGVLKSLDQPAFIDPITDRTLLPVRAIAESLGYTVNWNANSPGIITLIDNM